MKPIPNQPIYKDFQLPEVRFRTFGKSWSSEFSLQPMELAKYGFFYTGKSTNLVCYSCGGGFKNLSNTDYIDEIHAQFFGGCNFLKQRITLKTIDLLSTNIDHDSSRFLRKKRDKTHQPEPQDIPGFTDLQVPQLKQQHRRIVQKLRQKHRLNLQRHRIHHRKVIQQAEQETANIIAQLTTQLEKANERLACTICYAKDISHALQCGHTFCIGCIQTMKKCPCCDKYPGIPRRIFFSA